MARGWDSKAVEEQIEASQEERQTNNNRPTAEDAARKRQRQGIELSRKRILHELEEAESPGYQKILRDALAELDGRLAQIKV